MFSAFSIFVASTSCMVPFSVSWLSLSRDQGVVFEFLVARFSRRF